MSVSQESKALDPVALGLPHRDPFLFVDEVVAIVPGKSAAGWKTFCVDEAFFAGHFPGEPIVPGVILSEALAQLAGIAAGGGSGEGFLLSAIRGMKFPSSAKPNDRIALHAEVVSNLGALVSCEVRADVEDRPVAAGAVVLSRRG